MIKENRTFQKGSALLDAVIATALFLVLFIGFFALMQLGMRTVVDHKARAGALAIGRSHIEHIRSLSYTAVGVQGGTPSGVLTASEQEPLNGISYTVSTSVAWHDDQGDGVGAADAKPHDYKTARVHVTWPEHAGKSGSVVLSTFVADYEIE